MVVPATEPMISLSNVSKAFGSFHALRSCSLEVGKGEVLVVCGPSGSGKSTLIKCVNGLEVPDTGEIRVDGTWLDKTTDMPKLRARVGMVFQHFELFPHLDVENNIALAPIKVLRRSRAAALERAGQLLARVGLADQAKKYPSELSGGQQQRVAIARSLAMDPVVMLFDEPTSSLDPEMIGEVLSVMETLAGEGMTMMCVTHEMGFARGIADRIAFMDSGRILEVASPAEFFEATRTDRARQFLDKILRHTGV
jgi:glutamate/aspartate transport system ATP-binding protein